ncbi:hypothetical protein H2199_007405 [Coniosporium tulheliwenetii]|uniref:Uncharacterized protein n=1 Tax=Coniosporium tulheliwenetii TaxID=3383036 RepID=A0ACC2YRJ9_9PEZI|nr:hypothetical protein H2199_007405 [Cladosporium sp. JES 115]
MARDPRKSPLFTTSDIPSIYALESLPEVVRYQTWPPRTLAEAWTVVHEIIANRERSPRQHVELAVELHDGTFLGRVGAWVDEGKASLWFAFMPDAWGRGYATEAMRAFIPLLGRVKLEIECDPRNTGSWKLAERLGFVKESLTENVKEVKGEWVGSLVYKMAAWSKIENDLGHGTGI